MKLWPGAPYPLGATYDGPVAGITADTLRAQIRRGRLGARKLGRDWVVEAAEVARLAAGLDEAMLATRSVSDKWSMKELICHFRRMEAIFGERFHRLDHWRGATRASPRPALAGCGAARG